ncbi:MAG: head-tail adaptor protein [Pseudomonadota bacterium]
MLRAGKFDRRITLLKRSKVHDGLQQVETWLPIGKRWVSRKALSGGEGFEGEGRSSFSRYSLWLRFDSLTRTLTAADAIAMDNERFELLQPPLELGRQSGIELLVEGTSEGWSAS